MQNSACNDQLLPLSQCRKVFVQRDYSEGLEIRFGTKLPPEIQDRVDQPVFEEFVHELNRMYGEAEKFGCQSVFETLTSCLTCHTAQLCLKTQFDKNLDKIARYLQSQNERIFLPAGLWVTDPIERGLRVLEISVLNEPVTRRAN